MKIQIQFPNNHYGYGNKYTVINENGDSFSFWTNGYTQSKSSTISADEWASALNIKNTIEFGDQRVENGVNVRDAIITHEQWIAFKTVAFNTKTWQEAIS